MAEQAPQSYANHARYVPGYHFVASLLLFVNLVWSVVVIFRHFSVTAVVTALTAVALILIYWYERAFAVRNQDRIIRLEMQLRLERVLPAELKARVGDLRIGQLVALRFAGDAELPGLVKQVLAGQLADQKQIKLAIKDWQADTLRV
jgi:hypothetical protein